MAFGSNKAALPSAAQTQKLMSMMWSEEIADDPLKWVLFSFSWGQQGTPLEKFSGPRKWQREELERISESIRTNKERIKQGLNPKVYHSAMASGRGVGKSALVAWLSLWHLSVRPGGTTIVSANTDDQLSRTTFAEIGKWLTLSINSYWFERTQTKLMPAPWFVEALKKKKIDAQYYYINGKLWDGDNPTRFVGEHSPYGMMLIFDEASGIPQSIWDASEGFFSDLSPYRFWCVFSNPRSNQGAFFECFHKYREDWHTRNLDSRLVEGLDLDVFNKILEKHGADSRQARVEVLGLFPHQGEQQFIGRDLVQDAQSRELERLDDYAALVMGVDPARFGDDSTVIRFRRGRDARSIPPVELKGADNMEVANAVAHLIDTHKPDAVFIDSGAGAGIIDRLKERQYKVIEVGFGTASKDDAFADHRTELWAKMRDWLRGAMIDGHQKLADDLNGPRYEFNDREKVKLESKQKMKERGFHSPDNADALALTFHCPVSRRDSATSRNHVNRKARKAKGMDYKIFS